MVSVMVFAFSIRCGRCGGGEVSPRFGRYETDNKPLFCRCVYADPQVSHCYPKLRVAGVSPHPQG